MTETFLNDLALELYNNFFNPQKRLFLGYLGCALILALLWLTVAKNTR